MDQRLFQDLVRAAGPNRALAAEDFVRLVPLDSMTVEQTADLIADLEAAGVAVELDAGLMHPNKGAATEAAAIRTLPIDPPALTTGATEPSPPAHEHAHRMANPEQTRPARVTAWPGVIAAFLILCAVAALLWALSR